VKMSSMFVKMSVKKIPARSSIYIDYRAYFILGCVDFSYFSTL
jgi:hypothetical protein